MAAIIAIPIATIAIVRWAAVVVVPDRHLIVVARRDPE
jgi:hypothetical protein